MKPISREAARAAGLKRFFTGEPCRHHHIAERYVINGHCAACGLLRSNARYKQLRDRLKAKAREYYARDRRKGIENARKWAERNWEKVLDTSRRWGKRNPDKRRASQHKRLARKAAAPGFYTPSDIEALLQKQNSLCNGPHCRADISLSYTVDHIVPLTRGGDNWPANLQLLCQSCNSAKSNRTMAEWLTALSKSRPQREASASPQIPALADESPADPCPATEPTIPCAQQQCD